MLDQYYPHGPTRYQYIIHDNATYLLHVLIRRILSACASRTIWCKQTWVASCTSVVDLPTASAAPACATILFLNSRRPLSQAVGLTWFLILSLT